MSSPSSSSISYQAFNNSLQSQILILELLANITSKDTSLQKTDREDALASIEYLKQYTIRLNENDMEVLEMEQEESDKRQFLLDSITQSDKDGCLLRQLVMDKNSVAVQELLNRNVNVRGHCNGSTILHAAAAANDKQMIQLILDKGFDEKEKDSNGLSAVQRAVKDGNVEAVEILASRSNANRRRKEKLYHLAAEAGQVSVLQTLYNIYPKTMINEKNSKKQTPVDIAARNGHLEAVKTLLDMGADPNSALNSAARGNHSDIVEMLLQSPYIDVNNKDSQGHTPLHRALINGNVAMVNKLIGPGTRANVWIVGPGGNTALHYTGSCYILDLLERLTRRLDVNIRNDLNETPLHQAAIKNNKEVAIYLLNKGANVDALNDNRETPLYYAARENAKDVAEELKKRGARTYIRNIENKTPIDIAKEKGNYEIAYILK
ncbi:hypothetical protein L9F63_010646 [Diploptera punctata]|uniref:Ankyrin repeat protein n=1 Tax=Diploptera punctata TaxID=6984 RepID=A0AAD8AJ30_DIPPU|nr:hypothetical protein L9F63_010646 [Diploptera punctata]